jgi:hypothetical protein
MNAIDSIRSAGFVKYTKLPPGLPVDTPTVPYDFLPRKQDNVKNVLNSEKLTSTAVDSSKVQKTYNMQIANLWFKEFGFSIALNGIVNDIVRPRIIVMTALKRFVESYFERTDFQQMSFVTPEHKKAFMNFYRVYRLLIHDNRRSYELDPTLKLANFLAVDDPEILSDLRAIISDSEQLSDYHPSALATLARLTKKDYRYDSSGKLRKIEDVIKSYLELQ